MAPRSKGERLSGLHSELARRRDASSRSLASLNVANAARAAAWDAWYLTRFKRSQLEYDAGLLGRWHAQWPTSAPPI